MHTQLRSKKVEARDSAPTQVDIPSSHIAWQAALSYDSGTWNEAWPAKELFPALLHAGARASDNVPRTKA